MKYVFIDMDGTIAQWGYPDGRISGEYRFGDYLGKQPINNVIAEIYNKFSDPKEYLVFVVSAVPNSKAIAEKNAWLDNFFVVPYENRIFITTGENKIDMIEFYMTKIFGAEIKGNAILIDDRRDWLLQGESLGMEVYHPTKLVGDFQVRMAELQESEAKEKETDEKTSINNQVPAESVAEAEVIEEVEATPEPEKVAE